MKNFVQSGVNLTLTAPYAVTSGQGALVGSLFGVASTDLANGASGEFVTLGVFDLPKATGEAWTVGQKIYWDNTNRRTTTTLTSNTLIGVAMLAAIAGATTGRVRLGWAP
jgi:predicted RecA/RadA family phage recombinase